MTMEKCKCGNKLASIYSRYTGYNPVRIPNDNLTISFPC